MYATIPEDAEAILSKQAKNQAPGALDEESGGDSQPPRKSYSRIIAATLLLLSFVLVAGAAAGNASGSSSTECPPGTPPGAICVNGNGHAPEWPLYHDQSGKSVASSLSSTECPPGTDPGLHCITAYDYCIAHCLSGITDPELRERCRNTCSIALDRCCGNCT